MKNLSKKAATRLEHALLTKGWVLIKTMRLMHRKRNINLSYEAWDYNRYSSLELCSFEIDKKNLVGSVAEVGVFQGKFAEKINEAFPNRTFYLFDTFEGFHENDVTIDNKKGYSKGFEDFSNTSETRVLNRMKTKENCIIKKGYFPETANDIDDQFVFVSLDADLYKPTYGGLKFFYPKLLKGGYIFIHDFNNSLYAGIRDAVEEFCAEESIGYVPLSDIAGTVIIAK